MRLSALLIFCLSLAVYIRTLAPTFSFWDCGEFVAAGYILGVPHPPGSPLYILLSRLFSIIPIASDIAVRINLLSAISSAFTAMFAYLSLVQLSGICLKDSSYRFKALAVQSGAWIGALVMAFSMTNWNNSVEAEVYGLAMLLFTAIFWLSLLYIQKQGTASGERIGILCIFLGFVGIGVHMVVFLIIPVVALFFILRSDGPDWTWISAASVFAGVLFLIFALSSRPGEVPYYVPVAMVLLVYLFYLFSFERASMMEIALAAGLTISCAPLFVMAIALAGTGQPNSADPSTMAAVIVIGKAALGASALLAVYLLIQSRKISNSALASKYRRVALFGLVSLIGALVLLVPKGFDGFLLLAGGGTVVFVVALWKHIRWPYMIALTAISLVVLGIKPFVYGVGLAALTLIILGLFYRLAGWKNALAILGIAVIGFSVHLFLPIRADHQPNINESDPSESVAKAIDYLERKQYGSQSMVERMFKRRAEWTNQFGNYRRMGFWGFLNQQFGFTGRGFVIPLIIAVFGIWECIRRRRREGLSFLTIIFLGTVGMVLYMNFADGTRLDPVTRGDWLEVRDRDYFFTPGFVFLGMAIGLGVTMIMQVAGEFAARLSKWPRMIVSFAPAVLFFLPVVTYAQNFHVCDRTDNYIPYYYAMNLLNSNDENTILFTNGDNDTFPLWCIQEVYGFRTDVRVVNLSLANTAWYIRQLRGNQHLDLPWTDQQISLLRPYRTRQGATVRLQDQVVDALIDRYYDERPIAFSVTAGSGVRRYRGQSLDNRIELTGMSWKVTDSAKGISVNLEKSIAYFTDTLLSNYRGVGDPEIYQDEATGRLTLNYANGYLMLADTLRRAERFDEAEQIVRLALERIPKSGDAADFLANLLGQQGRLDELETFIETSHAGNKAWMRTRLGDARIRGGSTEAGLAILQNVIDDSPTYEPAFEALARYYFEEKLPDEMEALLEVWLEHNADDQRAAAMMRQLKTSGGFGPGK